MDLLFLYISTRQQCNIFCLLPLFTQKMIELKWTLVTTTHWWEQKEESFKTISAPMYTLHKYEKNKKNTIHKLFAGKGMRGQLGLLAVPINSVYWYR